MDCLTSRILFQKFCGTNASSAPEYVHLPVVFKAGLSSSYDGWAKYKEKVPDMLQPNQNVETTCNSKLKFRVAFNLKIYSPKGCRKTSQR